MSVNKLLIYRYIKRGKYILSGKQINDFARVTKLNRKAYNAEIM